jgi:cytochrome c oxidase cbb3-type subunit I
MRVLRNPFYLMAGVYLVLAVLALAALALVTVGVLAPIPGLVWMRIHLLTIGVVVQVVLGALPSLAAARLQSQPPGRAMNGALWLLVNSSLALLLYSMPQGLSVLAAAAAVGIFLAIVLMLASLHRRGACPPVGARAGLLLFVVGPLFFLVGIFMAVSMLLHWPAPGGFFGQLEAHVHANVWGFLALVVAGVLLERLPAAVGRPLRWPSLVPATSWLLVLGTAGLVFGPWLAVLPMTILGIAVYVTGTGLLLANLVATAIAGHRWTANIAHLLVAYIWMLVPAAIAPIILAITGKLPTGQVEAAAVSGLIAGWVLQVALAGLPLRLRELRQRATGWDGSWISLVLLNVGVLLVWVAAFISTPSVTTYMMAAGYGLVVVASVRPLVAVLKLLLAAPRSAPNEPALATLPASLATGDGTTHAPSS